MATRRALLILLSFSVGAPACGGDSSDNSDGAVAADSSDPKDSAGGDLTGGGVVPPDGGADAITPPTGEDVEVPPPPEGLLRVSYFAVDSYSGFGGANSVATGGLYDEVPSPLITTTEEMGACTVRTTTFLGTEGVDLVPKDAGDMTISGGTQDLVLEPAYPSYAAATADVAIFMGGETITFSTEGGKLPAFAGSVVAPTHPIISSPKAIVGQKLQYDPTQDLEIVWEGSGVGELRVRLSGPQNLPAPQVSVHCSFPVGAGKAAIPAAALAKITEKGTGTLAMDAVEQTTVVVEGWGGIELSARARGLNVAKTPYGQSMVFE